jgi:hypothetical protein
MTIEPGRDETPMTEDSVTGGMYYDRHGNPLTLDQWSQLLEHDEYRRIYGTMLDQGGWVSTVWLGLNHQYFGGPPLIFETMWFDADGQIVDMDRYGTEAQAKAGHWRMVQDATKPPGSGGNLGASS